MHLLLILILVFVGSAILSIALIWLRWRELWTPGLVRANLAEFRVEQNKLRLGESFLSREVLHPYLGYVFNPAADEAAWKACGSEKQPVNSFGLLSEKPELPRRSPGKVIIAVFGGSVAEHLAYDNVDALTAAFKSAGMFGDREIEIHCMAIAGFKQPQQLAELTYFRSLGAEFDVVINLDGFNEVALHPAENAFKGICHSFPRAWASRSATRIDPGQIFLFGQLAVVQQTRERLWNVLNHPAVRLMPQIYYAVRLYETELRSRKSRIIKSIRQFRPPTEENLNAALRQDTSGAKQLVELWSRSSALMNALCQSAQMRYFHFLQPNQYVPNSKPLSEEELASAYDPNHPYRPGVLEGYPLLKSAGGALREGGVSFTDLTELFKDSRQTVYSDRCCHFNRTGNEMIARAIAREIGISESTPGVAT
ncbi:MAG TPA: hypothetical protein VFE47_22465 [Tepidisphaeraceae bacterium]|jgi:hypothetical protein|nr:hypothetical protein [Tepidisphaeraceae bacterium]